MNGEKANAGLLSRRSLYERAIMPRLDSRLLYHDHIDPDPGVFNKKSC